MAATRILWGQVLVVVAILLATNQAATQWIAWRLAYQPQLGEPWTVVSGVPLYPPPAWAWWWYFFDAYAPEVFYEGAAIAASGGFVSIAVAIAMSVLWRSGRYGVSACSELRPTRAYMRDYNDED